MVLNRLLLKTSDYDLLLFFFMNRGEFNNNVSNWSSVPLTEIAMTVSRKAVTYTRIADDAELIHPDSGNVKVTMILECALLCILSSCTTVNICQDGARYRCQLSRKKGVCMEKEEAKTGMGCRLFQKKVRTWE
jgi:hypothetical protein